MKTREQISDERHEAWLERQMEARWEAKTDEMKEAKFLRDAEENKLQHEMEQCDD